jgi:ketosteroid isomerase-like protein
MGKKNGINIMLFVFIIILFMNLSCSTPVENIKEGVLSETDRAFSDMSVKEGMFSAFLNYIADEGVILRDNSFPSKGKEVLRQSYTGKSDTAFVMSWEPVFEKISESGDLGYTYGIWTNRVKASGQTSKGTYITIWHRQSDGTWKFVLDTGTQGLPEQEIQLKQ